MAGARHAYLDLVLSRAAEPARAWLLDRVAKLGTSDFVALYAGAGRRLGAAPVELASHERAALEAAGLPAPQGWPLALLGRVALLCLACEGAPPEAQVELVERAFRTGDNDERAAVLKALPALPQPERFVALAVDACRSHVQSVFEAIACENAYPARFFPEPNFNQLVLKAFFTGVAVQRIESLAARRTPELVRMAEAYASERRAAGRSVPHDLEVVTGTAPRSTGPSRSEN